VERAGPSGEELAHRRPWGLLRGIVLPLAVLGLILGGLWYWELRGGSDRLDDRYGTVELPAAKNPTGQPPLASVGRAAPDFLLEQPSGGTLRLSDLQGRPVVVNFWATWCPPCRREVPELVRAAERYGDDLVIVGVDLQEPDDLVLDFAAEFGVTYPLVVDRDGELADTWRLGGPIEGIPTTYFIDVTGVVRDFFYGPLNEERLEEQLAAVLPEAGG
jgi:thiol-disulfide isomerase/thioredoxin